MGAGIDRFSVRGPGGGSLFLALQGCSSPYTGDRCQDRAEGALLGLVGTAERTSAQGMGCTELVTCVPARCQTTAHVHRIASTGPQGLSPTNQPRPMTLSDAARELELYAENVEAFIAPVIKNLSRHHRRGQFSLDQAIKSIERYCLMPAARQYHLEHGSMSIRWFQVFPKAVRLEAAESIALKWSAEFKLGNYWD